MTTLLALLIIAAAVYCLVKRVDVRLVLLGAGLLLALLVQRPLDVLQTLWTEAINWKTIGPICSAMGFAYVLRATGCDREMVRLLIAPLRRVKWLLIPGGCLIGFLTNIAITSQTASAAAVGPILVPLLLAAGYHPIIAAATLVLGASGGGSLFNPGDADLVAIHDAAGAPMGEILERMFLPLVVGFSAAVAAFTLFARKPPTEPVGANTFAQLDESKPIHLVKALLPPLPVAMIFLLLPGWNLVPPLNAIFPKGLPVPIAMSVSTIIVLLVERAAVLAHLKAFAKGAGYAYANIITLIISASCFFTGLTAAGLTEQLVKVVSGSGFFATLASGAFPALLAVLSGSGLGPSVAFSKAVLPTLSQTDLPAALNLGVFGAIGASFGRTMSPVAAVVVFTAALVKVEAVQIVRRVWPALAVGFVAAFLVMLTR